MSALIKTEPKRVGRPFFSARRVRGITVALVRTLLIICICFIILFPMVSKIVVSFMEERDLYDATVKYVPRHFTLQNYVMSFKGLDYFLSLLSTTLISAGAGILTLICSAMVGYGFARFQFPFKRLWFGLVILILLVPPQTISVPLYIQFRFFPFGGLTNLTGFPGINMLGTVWPILLLSAFGMGIKNGLYIYLMRQNFRSIPRELEEAAWIDGCSVPGTFLRVAVPSSRPMMVTVFLFTFVWQWTDSYYATLFLSGNVDVLSVKLTNLATRVASSYRDWGGSMEFVSPGFQSIINNAGSILVILPLFVVFILCQRYFIEGIERSGLTG